MLLQGGIHDMHIRLQRPLSHFYYAMKSTENESAPRHKLYSWHHSWRGTTIYNLVTENKRLMYRILVFPKL
jgi:hypothetical protein